MPEQNKEGQTEAAVLPVLTEEMVADFDQNPHKLGSQSKEIRDAMKKRILEPSDESAAGESEADTAKPADQALEKPAGDPPAGDKPSETEAQKPKSKEDLRAALKAEADEANRLEQKIAAANARRKRLEDEWAKTEKSQPAKKPADFLEDQHQEDVLTRLERLEQRNGFLETLIKERDQEEIDSLTQAKGSKAQNAMFTEIDILQEDPKFAAVKMKKSFAEKNAEYSNWLDNLVGLSGFTQESLSEDEKANPVNALRAKAMERYESDADFKATVKIQPPEEMDKLSMLLEAHGRKAKHGGTIKGHLFEILDDAGILGDVVQRGRHDAAVAASNRTADAMRKQNEEIQTIAPGDGASRPVVGDDELTPASAAAFMNAIRQKQNNGQKLDENDKKMLGRIREFAKPK